MSTSPAQIAANRANAQLSTGPRTDAGRQTSSTNATTTGLSAATIFVRPDEQSEFDEYQAALLAEVQPTGALQQDAFGLLLHAKWNLHRCAIIEASIQKDAQQQGLADALLDDELARKLDRVYRYRKMHETSARRATAELRLLQTEQTWRRENKEIPKSPVLADTMRIIKKFGEMSVTESKVNDAAMRDALEAMLVRPPIRS